MKKLGLYVHVPFCLKKCDYCGFLSLGGCQDKIDLYFDKLLQELDCYKDRIEKEYIIDTVFFGGGTPTLAGPENIKKVIKKVSPFLAHGAEITIEANPKTFDEESLGGYLDAGVNRLSIGCQSLDDKVLKALGRVHTRAEFLEAFQAARRAGFSNINVDLMFAVPGQNMDIWKESLSQVIALKPEHISAYSLQIEEGTPFYHEYKYGRLGLLSDDEERLMHHEAIKLLQDSGYEHYEISNFAKNGYRCRHNLKYWNMDEYLGVGLGASSFFGGARFKNADDLDKYLTCQNMSKCVEDCHISDQKDLAGETVFTGLRKRDGFTKKRFEEIVGQSYDDFFQYIYEERKAYIDEGLLVENQERVYLTEKGIDRSNEIMAEFV